MTERSGTIESITLANFEFLHIPRLVNLSGLQSFKGRPTILNVLQNKAI